MKKINFKKLLKFLVMIALSNIIFAFANYKLPTYSYIWGFLLGVIVINIFHIYRGKIIVQYNNYYNDTEQK